MIKIENLNKIFNQNKANEFVALKNINVTIKKNEFIILRGVSGSGKSTLLSIMASYMKPTDGLVEVNNEPIAKLPDFHISRFRLENIGFIFQSYNLFENLTVSQNVSIGLIPLQLNQNVIDKKVLDALNTINIIHKKDEIVSNLSGGEKQRTTIARAIVNQPDIILCDEPTANLDHNNSLIFIDIMKQLKALNKTIVIATHDTIFENIDIPHRIIEIKDGEIIY